MKSGIVSLRTSHIPWHALTDGATSGGLTPENERNILKDSEILLTPNGDTTSIERSQTDS